MRFLQSHQDAGLCPYDTLKYLKKMSYYHFPNKFRKKMNKMAVCNYILECKKSKHEISGYGLGLISAPDILARHFDTDIPSRGLFGTRIFRHKNISAWVFFGTMDVSAWGTLQHWNISAQCYFGTWTHAEMPKCPWFRNIPMPKCCHAEISSCQKVHMMKYPCRNASC